MGGVACARADIGARQLKVNSTFAVIATIATLLAVFILIPIGSVFLQSFSVDIPLPPREIRGRVQSALQFLTQEQRQKFLRDSREQLDPNQAMETTAATLAALGFEVPWDRKAPYAEQIAAAQVAVAKLNGDQHLLFEQEYQLQIIVTHKKIPLAFMVKDRLSKRDFESLRSGQSKGFSLEYYRQLFKESRYVKATLHSLFVALLTCAITVPLAFLLAFGVNRRYIRNRNIVRMVILAPLVSPPVIMAFAAILLFGRQGLITHGLLDKSLGWINSETTNIYGLGGVVLAMTLSYLPHAFIMLDDVMKRHDGRLEEAAAAHGADGFAIFRKVTLPMSRPGLVRAGLVVFILSMTDFGNPLVIGRGYSVLSGVIYDEIIGFQNMSLSSALCVWLVIPALMAFLLFEILRQKETLRDAGKRYLQYHSGTRTVSLDSRFSFFGGFSRVYCHLPILWGHRDGVLYPRLGNGFYLHPRSLPAPFRDKRRDRNAVWHSADLEQREGCRPRRDRGRHSQHMHRVSDRAN